nr:hypothetical protein [Tanacetum cinerariifolium]
MPNNVKTYNGMRDLKEHVKIFQVAAQVERWAMPTWCHMFNSTLIGAARVWFDELPPESIDSYKSLKAAFLAYFMQQKKYVKDPIEIYNIKQKDGETIEDFMKRFKVETGRMNGALSIMEEMMITTTAFIRGEAAAASKKKSHASWKAQDQSKRKNSDKSQWRNRGIARHRSRNGQTHDSSHVCDGGSSMEILNEHYFNRLRPEINSQMVPVTTSLTGFSSKTIWSLGQLRLLVIIGDAYHSTRAWMNFMILRLLSPYNGEIVTIRSTILLPTECTSVITSSAVSKEERTRPDNFKVALHSDFPDQELAIEGTLSDKGRTELCSILKKNLNIFSWKPSDMTGVSRTAAKIEYHARWAQYHVQTKNVGQRTDLSGFSHRDAERKTASRASGRNTTRAVDTFHGWLIMSSNNKAEYEELIAGTYVAKEDNMVKYLDKVKSLVRGFTNFSISQVPQSKNKKPDALNKIVSTSFTHLSKRVLVEVLKDKSIKEKEVTTVVEEDGPTWMSPIVEYLKEGTFPSDRKEVRKLHIKARQYELMEGILYRRSFLTSWLRCVGPLQVKYVIREIHEGSCSIHEIDIAGPFPEGPGKVKFLIVAMDYFTKWIEAKKVATITVSQVKKFVWDNIVCRFGLPVKHLQSNRPIERENRSLGKGIKACLGEGNKNWVKELPHVLWAHPTMIKSSHGDTPFSLTYRTEEVIPTEIGMPTYCTTAVDVVSNDVELRLNLDLLEEWRRRVAICEAKAKSKMTKYYNARVRSVTFRPGDFIYRSNDASHTIARGKLGPKWEGPYEVVKVIISITYMIIGNPRKKIDEY